MRNRSAMFSAYKKHIEGLKQYHPISEARVWLQIYIMNNTEVLYSSVTTVYVIQPQHVEIILAQLNKLTVPSVYKPPNEQFSFGSNLASTQLNVVIGDFNSQGVEGGYRSTDETAD